MQAKSIANPNRKTSCDWIDETSSRWYPPREVTRRLLLVIELLPTVTLDWRDGLTIIATLLAIDSYRRLHREKVARRESRHQLMRQVAATSFHSLATEGFDLEAALTQGSMERCRERADRLRLSLAEACGSWTELLVSLEKEKSDAASLELAGLQGILHTCGGAEPSPEQLIEMRQRCATVYTLLGEISGKLQYLDRSQAGLIQRVLGKLRRSNKEERSS